MKAKLIKKILATAGALVLVAAIIVGDNICYQHENEITSFLCPDKVIYDTSDSVEALGESDAVIRRSAGEGITLLKNTGALPLDRSDLSEDEKYRVNLFGVGSTNSDENGFFLFGAGSGAITCEKSEAIFLRDALENHGFAINNNLYNYFLEKKANPAVDWWEKDSSLNYRNYAKVYSDTAIITVSRFTGENAGDALNYSDTGSQGFGIKQRDGSTWRCSYTDSDEDGRNFCQLSLREEAMINWCAENFENVIVIINSGNVMELGALDNAGVDAVLYCPYPGQSGADEIGKILIGETNPSGKTTDTFAYSTTENAPYNADAVYRTGNNSSIQIAYTEDIYFGYKWYETADAEGYFTAQGKTYEQVVQYPFGHGLSYTNFEWTLKGVTVEAGDAEPTLLTNGGYVENKDTTVKVNVEVKNTGNFAGKEIVQLYTTAPYTRGGIEKAHVMLTDFAKTDTLYPASQAGEGKPNSQVVTLTFDLYDIASYDCYDKNANNFAGWELEGGEYCLSLRNNAHEVNACANAEFNFNVVAGGFKYENDPHTNTPVENRFTGATAEAGVPTDGSNDTDADIVYLSRADFAGTFPTSPFTLRTKGYDKAIRGINGYMNDSDHYSDLTMPTFNASNGLYLYTLKNGAKATLSDLQGYSGNEIVPNEDLICELGSDYNSDKWDQLLEQLSVLEIKQIVTQCSCGTLPAVSIGKPRDRVYDGPAGLTNSTLSWESMEGVSGFSCEALNGMTWNKDLLREVGAAMATEVAATKTIGMYAPALDTHRHPYNGRNFEQYGEDSVLCGKLGSKQVYGMITHGIQPSVKHFVISTPGKNPVNYNSWITEQNLRENYLKAFEWTVKEGNTNFIMTSFNNIGGVKCAFSYALNTQILREEWGFKGSVITDYNVNDNGAGRTTASLIRAGNDLRFQGSEANRAELDENNAVDMALAVRSVKNSLYSFCNTYYRAKEYNPNFTVTTATVIPAFNWWVPSLIAVNVIIMGGFLFLVFWLWIKDFVFKKKEVVASVEDTAETEQKTE